MFQDWLSDRASKDTGTRLAVKVQFGLEPWKGYGDWIGVTYIGGVPMVDRERVAGELVPHHLRRAPAMPVQLTPGFIERQHRQYCIYFTL